MCAVVGIESCETVNCPEHSRCVLRDSVVRCICERGFQQNSQQLCQR